MIGRPETSETDPYYFTYIRQVAGGNILEVLERQRTDAASFFSALTEETSLFRYSPEKWSLRQALNHVTDTERAFAFRALWFARGFETPLPGYDQNIAASGAEADRTPWAAHIEEFQQVRLSTLSLFRNMPPEAWLRGGIASGKPFTVRALAFIIAGHTTHHIRVLRDRYLSSN